MARPLPARQTQGDVTFVLNNLTIKTNFSRQKPTEPSFNHPLAIVPALDALDHGAPVTAQDALDLELYDSSGNFASKEFDNALFLSPQEKFWEAACKIFWRSHRRIPIPIQFGSSTISKFPTRANRPPST